MRSRCVHLHWYLVVLKKKKKGRGTDAPKVLQCLTWSERALLMSSEPMVAHLGIAPVPGHLSILKLGP